MIDHTGIRVGDLARSTAFYAHTLETLGYSVTLQTSKAVGFGAAKNPENDPGGDFWLTAGEPHTPRTHIAFRATSEVQVVRFFQAACEAGGTDNGPPGLRPNYHARYFAAFVLDPDGYNIEAVFHLGREVT